MSNPSNSPTQAKNVYFNASERFSNIPRVENTLANATHIAAMLRSDREDQRRHITM